MVALVLSLLILAPDVIPEPIASAPAGQQVAIAMQVSFVVPASAKPVEPAPVTEKPTAEKSEVSPPIPEKMVSKKKAKKKKEPPEPKPESKIKPAPDLAKQPVPKADSQKKPAPQPEEKKPDVVKAHVPETLEEIVDSPVFEPPESAPVQLVSEGAGAHQAEQFSKPLFAAPPKPPRYPRLARKRGREGTVWVDIWLGSDGQQFRLEIAKSSGWESLDKSALAAVNDWRFLPYKKNGVGHPSRLRIPVAFSLN